MLFYSNLELNVFQDAENEKAKVFTEVAAGIDDIPFGISTTDEVKKELGLKGEGVVLLKKFDDGKAVFEEEVCLSFRISS